MTWLGLNRDTTPVDPRPGVSELQTNTHLRVANELQRRWGFQSSSIAKQDGPILGIASADWAGGNFITFLNGTASPTSYEMTGTSPPPAQPPGPKRRRPVVVAGNPVAPVINFITPTPASPGTAGGASSFLANITYDGLSGALTYTWSTMNQGGMPFAMIPVNAQNVNPGVYQFGSSDFYSYSLTVTTALNGFSANRADGYLVM